MKKLMSLLMVSMMLLSLTACGKAETSDGADTQATQGPAASATQAAIDSAKDTVETAISASDIKVGFIFIGDQNDGYTYTHYQAALAMEKELGIPEANVIFKWNVPENEECFEAACELADAGCNIIFANSFGHEDYMLQAAEMYPDIQFSHCTGYQARTSSLTNVHNYYPAVYESRYVAGIVAGYKLQEMIDKGEIKPEEAKVGYVGAFAYSQVISGYDAFYLGVKSVCSSATMVVKYTGSWGDQATEYDVAKALIQDEGCKVISQHSNTTGPASACEELGAYVVGYNISMINTAPNYALTSATLDYSPYVIEAVKDVMGGMEIPKDWAGGYSEAACMITEINDKAFDPTTLETMKAKVSEVETGLKDGSLPVFDCSKFTVDKKTLDENTTDYYGDKTVYDGVYHESSFQSAPGIVFIIDGIKELNKGN